MLQPTKENASRYLGRDGFLRVSGAPNQSGEAPIWCPIRVIESRPAWNSFDFLVEPLGGYGTLKVRATRVFFDDPAINHCKDRPV